MPVCSPGSVCGPAVEISFLFVIVSAKNVALLSVNVRDKAVSARTFVRPTREKRLNRLKHQPPVRATNLNSGLSRYNPIQ